MEIKQLKQRFIKLYKGNESEIRGYFAPGRVNLIGEHVDYNGGYVFPCALSFGTYILARSVNTDTISFQSENYDFKASISRSDWQTKHGNQWINYPLGVIDQFLKKGHLLGGLQLLFFGDMPNGAGLSSSASVEMATAVMINDIFNCNINMLELIKMAQKAENQFVGVNCGIMDQFASGMGKKEHAIFLDCSTLEFELVPLKLNGYKLIISNTNKPRKLADSKYNERRSECEKAVEYINKIKPIKLLGELSTEEFNKYEYLISEGHIRKRARHVVTEIARTREAVKELRAGNLLQFGHLMNLSHDSLRDDYEVTGVELDTLVEEARKIKGTIGSRMTGAGFGGCTVSLVKDTSIDTFIKEVGANYRNKTGLVPDFYTADISDGANCLTMN